MTPPNSLSVEGARDLSDWPHGGGEMGARIRAFDWSTVGWSQPEAWPLALRSVVDIMLGSRQPMFVVWGFERRMLYNDDYMRILGDRHPDALGRGMGDIWREVMVEVSPMLEAAFDGQSIHMDDIALNIRRDDRTVEAHFAFSYTPIRNDEGRVRGVFCVCNEITERVHAERRIRFHFDLSERLRALASPGEVLATASEILGRQLGAASVGYAEFTADRQHIVVEHDWTDGTLGSVAGRHRVADFSATVIDELRALNVISVSDVRADPRTAGEAGAAFLALGIEAFLGVPLAREGELAAALFILAGEPHEWSEADAVLARETVERTSAALDRARAEGALRESEARFRAMADSAPSPVWITDAPGAIAFVNQAFADYAGRGRNELLGDVWVSLIHPDDLMGVAQIRAAARAGLAPYTFEARFRRGDGEWRYLRASSNPRFDGTGVFQGYVGIAMDLTDIRRAEAALRESEERFRRVAEDAPVMLWMGDERGRCIYLNKAQRAFWGVEGDVSEFDWSTTLHPEDRETLSGPYQTAMAVGGAFEVEARYRRADGEMRTLRTRAEPRRDADGQFVGMVGVNVDVTEARRAQARQHLLINELNHRVKNTLATVQSMILQTLRSDATPEQMAQILQSRVLALSAAHDVLTRENWESALLHEVVAGAVTPYEGMGEGLFDIHGPRVRVAPRLALSLAMALHELATNAAKYGALRRPEGRVGIRWRLDDDAQLELEWRETGGPPVTAPTRRGFGSRLIEQGLARELGAEVLLDFAPGGVVCRMSAALADGGVIV